MTLKEEVLQHKVIFSLMYSPDKVDFRTLEEQIIKINTSELKWYINEEGFVYVWGWPGPDANFYTRKTYGKGWAYTRQEIIEAWENENENKIDK